VKRVACAILLLGLFPAADIPGQNSMSLNLREKAQQLHTYGPGSGNPVILSSGDLGWAGLVLHIAEFLAAHGYYVIGFDSKVYLTSFTTKDSALAPRDVPRDYKALIDMSRQKSSVKPLLVGVSEGAGLSVLAATEPDVKSAIQGVLGLGLPDQNELGWKWQDSIIWITKKAPNEPSFMVEDIIQKVSPAPLAEIHSTHDEFLPLEQAKAMFARAGEPKKMWIIEAANHRFSDSRDELDRKVLEALQWIKSFK
jgi:dienelactone hydrolase